MDVYTNIEQSKILAQIIDKETADFCWGVDEGNLRYNKTPWTIPWKNYTARNIYLPCWSLAALMDILPASINVGNDLCTLKIHKNHNNKDLKNLKADYDICYLDKNNNGVGFFKMNLLEAVIEMINYLVENKLI
jgi:hypothetical protein